MSPLRAGNVHPKFAAARRPLTRWGRDAAHSHSAVCTRASTAQHEPRGKARVVPFSIFPSSLFCCMDTFVARTRPLSPQGVVDDCTTAVVAIACAGSLGVWLCSVLQVVRRVPLFPFSIPSHPSFKWVGWPWFVSTVVGEENICLCSGSLLAQLVLSSTFSSRRRRRHHQHQN